MAGVGTFLLDFPFRSMTSGMTGEVRQLTVWGKVGPPARQWILEPEPALAEPGGAGVLPLLWEPLRTAGGNRFLGQVAGDDGGLWGEAPAAGPPPRFGLGFSMQ